MELNVLLLGSGGREHALAWSIKKSARLKKLFIAPGNPGTAEAGTNVDLALDDFEAIAAFIEDNHIDLTIVGPEQPLVEGITDFLEAKGCLVFGPSGQAAQLEGSKKFAKEFMERNNIPTAAYASFNQYEAEEVLRYIKEQDEYPIVLKANGLAGGKGVFICETEAEAEERLKLLKEHSDLNSASETLIVEEFMEGEEASVFVISDGKTARVIHNAQDHKRIGEGDTGLNTGGMGAYCPAPVITPDIMRRVEKEIILPTITGMLREDMPYKGILYCGLMITEQGPKVVEYNCRFGDPECQAILPSLKSDLLELMVAAAKGEMEEHDIILDNKYRCCVVMASDGYPESYKKGKLIEGIEDVADGAVVFHAGTALKDGRLVTNGGRVLSVVGAGDTLQDAIRNTYKEVKKVTFKNAYYRSDIGVKGLAHLDE